MVGVPTRLIKLRSGSVSLSLRVFRAAIALTVVTPVAIAAQVPAPANASRLTIERIFASPEFFPRGAGQLRWLDDSTYTALQADPQRQGVAELARINARTGAREVLVGSALLTPSGASAPLAVENYVWSPDKRRMLVFTSSERVWRENSRGDYWVLDLTSRALRKLGGAD